MRHSIAYYWTHIFYYGSQLWRMLLFTVAPPCCAVCRYFINERRSLCTVCTKKIKPVVSVAIPLTASVSMQVRALGTYEFPLKSLVLAKSSGNRLAAVHLGTLLRDADMLHGMQIDYIVSIPLHWSRLAWRGYNQADEIARVLAKKLGKPHIHALTRTTATPFQSRVHVTERARNVAHAFRVSARHKAQLKGARILLVDDLMTTGATLKSAARTLHFDCKPASIAAIVACRTL